jgi:hypothetical protein
VIVMYAHQVIDDLITQKKMRKRSGAKDKLLDFNTDVMLINIKNSIKFNIENVSEVYKLFIKDVGTIIFSGNDSKYQKMPYKTIWIDWKRSPKDTDEKDSEKEAIILKRAILATEIFPNIISSFVFNCVDDKRIIDKFFNDKKEVWITPLYGMMFSIGCNFYDNEHFQKFIERFKNIKNINNIGKWVDGNTLQFPITDMMDANYKPHIESLIKMRDEDGPDQTILNSFLKLVNCKNVSTEKIHPPEKLNKKRRILGKQPLFTYHTLVLNSISDKKHNSVDSDSCGIKQRLHFCRGHFKEFTPERPLFGRLTGLYWWQPQVRGNKDLGIVHKDYKVRVA